MLVSLRSARLIGILLGALIATAACRREAGEPDASTATHPRVEQRFRDYMAAINAHDVDRVMDFYAPELVQRRHGKPIERTREELRDIREWETPMQARFEYEVVTVADDRLTASLLETNLLYAALDVRRPMVSEYRWRDGRIVEMNLREIRETGRIWKEALAELEAWLVAKSAGQTAGLLSEGRLAFDGEGGRKLVPFLAEYRKATDAARAVNEPGMRGYIAALDRHDVDGQYRYYSPEMLQPAEGQTVAAKREKSRDEREFEAGSNARWSYAVVGAGLDSLEATVTEGMDFYDALGVGPRSHRARYRFRDGKIADIETWDWTQPGRPYSGARDRFVAWMSKERPAQASRLLKDGRLVFKKRTAVEMTALAREWFGLQPCRLYHPSFNSSGTQIAFSSDCEGPWGIYVVQADGTLPRRVTPPGMEARMPNWSPDGARLLFQSDKEGNGDIYTVDVDGSGLTRMTDHPKAESSGAFSPDGTRILFASDRGGMNELFLIPAAGGEAVQVTRNKGAGFRSVWAPDSSHILFRASEPPNEAAGTPGEFHRVRPDGADAGKVAGGPRREFNQAYSPDGKKIAFDAHEDGMTWESGTQWDVWVMNADGTGRRNLTAGNNVNDWGPSWSPDGKTIVFLSGLENVYDLHLMNADGTNVRRITNWTAKRTPSPTSP
ncbi:MAG: nuclear transport factor 2 family protein [Thermoanaerobaculia bacterium]